MEEQKLKEEIRSLFKELINESEEIHYVQGSHFSCILPPSSLKYCENADELVSKAIELHDVNKEYNCRELMNVSTKEVELIRLFQFEYTKDKKRIKPQSENKLRKLMRDATSYIYRSYTHILKDIVPSWMKIEDEERIIPEC